MPVDVNMLKTGDHVARHLSAIVETSNDAIISKNLDGIIQSWNKAAERIFGWSAEEIVGKSILTLIPPERHSEEAMILGKIRAGERIEHYETVRLRKDGDLIDISVTISPLADDSGQIIGASKIARDVTERRRAERLLQLQTQRLETLNRVAQEVALDLDLERIVQTVTDMATEACGAQYGAFFYSTVGESGQHYRLRAFSGTSRSAFEEFFLRHNARLLEPILLGSGAIRSDDVRKDPQYSGRAPQSELPENLPAVVSFLAVPVVSAAGEVHGGLFVGHDQPGMFSRDAGTLMSAVAAHAALAIDNARLHLAAQNEIRERKRAEASRELLLQEIKHRVKNTLATVQAMATQSFRQASRAEKEAFLERLHALANAHDLLTQKNWVSADAKEAVERALSPFRDGREQRIIFAGPTVELPPGQALLLAMFLHELGTNAVKYGALSNAAGAVDVQWGQTHGAQPRLVLEWRESGGPPVVPPTRQGFGTQMIERALKGEGGSAKFEYRPTGLVCTIVMLLQPAAD